MGVIYHLGVIYPLGVISPGRHLPFGRHFTWASGVGRHFLGVRYLLPKTRSHEVMKQGHRNIDGLWTSVNRHLHIPSVPGFCLSFVCERWRIFFYFLNNFWLGQGNLKISSTFYREKVGEQFWMIFCFTNLTYQLLTSSQKW